MKQINQKLIIFCLLVITSINLSAQSFKLQNYTTFKLPNGLTINLMEQHDVPVISVSAILPAGAIYDYDKAGLASLTATALKHGTKNFTKIKLDEELDFTGADVSTYASKEFSGLSSKFAAKDKDKVLAIIKEILLNPVFDTSEFEKEKSRLLVTLEQQKESPRLVIGSYFDSLLYGNHVYGNVLSGNNSTVSKLTVNDVKDFYKTNYKPNNAVISIVGDFATNEMKAKLTKLFSGWEKSAKEEENPASKTINIPTENKVLLVNKGDAKETTFYIGAPGVNRNNPDYVAIDVVNTLFGGRFTSMLNDELRVNSGLTYGASSRFNALKNGGSFVISTFTAVKTTEPAIDKALEVLNKLHTNGIDEKSLSSAKNYVKGQFPPRYETTEQLSNLLSQMFWYNFDKSFIDNFEKNVDGLDLVKANQIIAKYFPKDKLQFVLVGKSEDIKKIAEKYGKVTELEIKDDIKKVN
ncbi:M16 family metallopeptidase [Flavobacterium gawalongense]|uniref:Insulinase family protein n=1 Tax=Flavobacterium gawalongense TaxID=2594432 RepID=A0A553BG72_9FLAO|nr:pitrilysin family protein [Flavobacterium gawalongense]TRW99896.1 insulinase family protein [Flavobacterium gawalongense]TRX04360.1 insulinase family protein [Flavobacterium gawalongense]TRX07251.1 insulinase family protein [Flavobacterium gawalongense]TRX08002.1 insulinase family protein [Flavobacterium gawalongense]TRX24254.1 insulinase family protein [Flavobacterium gawalongense]